LVSGRQSSRKSDALKVLKLSLKIARRDDGELKLSKTHFHEIVSLRTQGKALRAIGQAVA
jgi:hypothetical protein